MTEREPGPLEAIDKRELKELLTRCWMTHDGTWFLSALQQTGIETANKLNRTAIRSLAPIEVRRVLSALGMEKVESFEDLKRFIEGIGELLIGDYLASTWEWRQPDTLLLQVHECFAYKSMQRLGVIDRYECGIFERIRGWLDALEVSYEVKPTLTHCLMHRHEACVREFRFSFATPEGDHQRGDP